MNLASLTIKAKLNILIVIVSMLLIGIGLTGLWAVQNANSALYTVYNNRLLSIAQMNEVRNNQMQIRINLLMARLNEDAFERLEVLDKVSTNIFNVSNIINEFGSKELSKDEKELFDRFADARMALGRDGVLPVVDLLQADRIEKADEVFHQVLSPAYDTASESIDALIAYQVDNAKNEYDRVSAMANLIQSMALGSIVSGLVIVIVLGFLITRSINKGVSTLAMAAQKLANGGI
jgi:Four helix bundle sensory module for signal transduction